MSPTDALSDDAATRGRCELRADRLRALLHEHGTTQVAAAVAMGIDRGHLNDLLRGRKTRLGLKLMEALRRHYPDHYDELVVWTTGDNADELVGARLGETG